MLSAFTQAWTSWKTTPGVALLAVIAFAVGIGSTTAIFTVINGVLLQPLPYPGGERFVSLGAARTTEPGTFFTMKVGELQAYERQSTSFDVFGWFGPGRYHLTAPGDPQFVPGAAVTPSLARQLGSPLMGQWFADDSSAVLSSALWQRLGGRRDVIGTVITLDGRTYTVTGVMPPAFQFPIAFTAMTLGDTEVWIPLDPSPPGGGERGGNYFAYARRKPGVSLEQAAADVKRIAAGIAAGDPARYPNYTAHVAGVREMWLAIVGGSLRAPLLMLLGGAGLLLLIACANVATLLLARSVARARDTAIRVALGASRRQLALRYFAEGALVSVAGAAAGVALSTISLRYITAAASLFVPRADDITMDWTVLGFSVAIALVTGVLAGLAPLWQAFRTPPNAVLSEGVRASASGRSRRLSKAFVVAEIALAFTLLTASAILVVHLRNLARVPLGFDPDGLVTFELTLPARIAASDAARPEQMRLMDALRQMPGVTGAAFANQLPVYPGCLATALYVEGRVPGALAPRVCVVVATPDFFSTMRIPLRAGRLLNASDTHPTRMTVVVNEAAARAYWPDRDPIGASGRLSRPDNDRFDVVGVVGDVRNNGLNQPTEPEVYLSAWMLFADVPPVNPISIVVRSDAAADHVIASARRVIRQANPALVMTKVMTMRDMVGDTLQFERFNALVMTFFGLAALLMAMLGIYGAVSYFVRQRTVELGTRMALGAVNRDLVTLVLGGGLKLALLGVAAGAVALAGGIWMLMRFLEISDVGWLPFAFSTLVVVFVAGAAASVPAWRTTLISPMVAMREQSPSMWAWASRRMQGAVRGIRETIGSGDSHTDLPAADMLTTFVDAARAADSYSDALRAVLGSVCDRLQIESAVLLARRDDSTPEYHPIAGVGALNAAAPAVPADGFLIARLRAYPSALPFAPDELDALAEWAAGHRPDRLSEIRALAAADVCAAVPLRTRRGIIGVLLLGGGAQRHRFTRQERQVLRACAGQFALMIENARLTDRVVEQETLRRDIALASEVQRRLLPEAPPSVDVADFAAASVPARRIGGDYYDFIELRNGALGIALADVSGKGVPAALIMSVVQASLRIISSEGEVPLPRLVARMNEFVYRSTPGSKYATFFYAQLDDRGRLLRYVNAGHNAPYLLRAGRPTDAGSGRRAIEQLSVGGTVVGMFPQMDYEEGTVDLFPGDVLLAFTDGVPEAHNPESDEFGEERIQELLCQTAHLSANEIAARLSDEMAKWIRDAEQYDDLTFIVMKVR